MPRLRKWANHKSLGLALWLPHLARCILNRTPYVSVQEINAACAPPYVCTRKQAGHPIQERRAQVLRHPIGHRGDL
jgi:hypothetical protein